MARVIGSLDVNASFHFDSAQQVTKHQQNRVQQSRVYRQLVHFRLNPEHGLTIVIRSLPKYIVMVTYAAQSKC